jgi:hypothetical protein
MDRARVLEIQTANLERRTPAAGPLTRDELAELTAAWLEQDARAEIPGPRSESGHRARSPACSADKSAICAHARSAPYRPGIEHLSCAKASIGGPAL